MVKKDGILTSKTPLDKAKLDALLEQIKEDDVIEVTYEIRHNNATHAQKAKVHICIRAIAEETGATIEDVEKDVKRRAGLIINGEYMSFKNCSKEELSRAIQTCMEIGDVINVNLH